jgi:glycerol uptake facilitator protein
MNEYVAEFVGTAVLILLGTGVVANVLLNKSKGQNSGWIVITFGWGLAVAVAVYATGQFSGAHINPAVTLGFASAGIETTDAEGAVVFAGWEDVPGYVIAQFAGAMVGAFLTWLAYFPHWVETEDPGLKLAVFSTGPAVRSPIMNIVTEVIGTFVLVFGVVALIDSGAGTLTPLLVGLLVLGIGISLGGPTGYAINPARDLGPRIAHFLMPIAGKGDSDWAYSWIPVVGPVIGGILGALVGQQIFDLPNPS